MAADEKTKRHNYVSPVCSSLHKISSFSPAGITFLAVTVIAAAVCAIYYSSLQVPFIFDDFQNIVTNSAVHPDSLKDIGAVVMSEYSASRPLSLATFALNYFFHGLHPKGYHIVNILIHVINSLLLFWLLRGLYILSRPQNNVFDKERRQTEISVLLFAFCGAVLWAVHPIQTQAVTYIVQRMTSLVAMFYLLGMLIVVQVLLGKMKKVPACFLWLICFVLAMASKENAATMPAAALLVIGIFGKVSKRYLFWGLGLILLTGCALLLLYDVRVLQVEWNAILPGRDFSPYQRLLTQSRILFHYISLYLLPVPERLHLSYHPEISTSLFHPITTLYGVMAIVISIAAAICVRKKYPLLTFSILFFYVTHLVESTFLNLELAFIHRMYLPSLFLFAGCISSIPELPGKKYGYSVLPFTLIAAFILGYWTIERNIEYQQPAGFWQLEQKRGGNSSRILNNVVVHGLSNSEDHDNLLRLLNTALVSASVKERAVLLHNKGYLLYLKNDYDAAFATIQQLMRESGAFGNSPYLAGKILLAQKKPQRALAIVKSMERLGSDYDLQRKLLLVEIFMFHEQYQSGIDLLLQELDETEMNNLVQRIQYHHLLATIFEKKGNLDQAFNHYHQVAELYPDDLAVWRKMYFLAKKMGDKEKTENIREYMLGRE